MSALSGSPRRSDRTRRELARLVSESFWTAVALTLALLVFFLVASGPRIVTWQVSAVTAALFVIWGLHARSVRRHSVDVHRDERWRHARERRGF